MDITFLLLKSRTHIVQPHVKVSLPYTPPNPLGRRKRKESIVSIAEGHTKPRRPILRDNTNVKCLRASQHPIPSYTEPKKGTCPSSPASIIGPSPAVKAAGNMSCAGKSAFVIVFVRVGIPPPMPRGRN